MARSESRTGLQSVPPRFWRCGFGMGFHDILESFPTALLFRNHSLWQHKLMDSATTHEQTMPPHRQFGFVYGILLFYGCQEPPQNVTIPLSPYHNPLPLLCHLPSRQRRQTRFPGFGPFPRYALARCSGRISAKCRCYGEPASIPCPRHNFCCFHSKCRKTSPSCTPASAVEASRSSLFMNP